MTATLVGLLSAVLALAPTPPAPPLLDTDFSAPGLPAGCTALDGAHNVPGGTSAYRPDEVSVSGGMLRLGLSRRPADGRAYTSGGVACEGLASSEGRVEFRAKAPPRSAAVATAGAVVVPLRSGGFHTYTIEWSPARVRVLVDGRVHQQVKGSAAPRWPAFALRSGAPTAELLVDRVRVWGHRELVLALPAAPLPVPVELPQQRADSKAQAAGWWIYAGGGAAVVLLAFCGYAVRRRVRLSRTTLPPAAVG